MSITVEIITLLLGIIAGGSAVALYKSLEKRITDLESASKSRLPFKTADEIEDATAAILKLKHELDFKKELIENALSHLTKARNNK